MKFSAKTFGFLKFGGLDASGGILGGAVFIPDSQTTPIQPTELTPRVAVEVSYVNTKLGSYPGFVFTSGTIAANRLPAFSGDVVKSIESNICYIPTLPLTPGNFSKVTVNVKGLTVSGSGLTESDIPNLDWSKVSLNRPNTLGGYGINDALSVDGGVISGSLQFSTSGLSDHLINKTTLETIFSGEYIIPGQIISKVNSASVPYFLKCNGAEPKITDYPNLYSAIGDTFTVKVSPGCGLPHLFQFQFNNNTTSTGSWTSGTAFPININRGKTLVTKNRVYVIGGASDTTNTSSLNTIYSANIDPITGVIGVWSLYGNLPISVDSFELVMNVNRVYIVGGSINGVDTSAIYSAIINLDGSLGAWGLIGNLPFPLSNMSVFISRNFLTVVGGSSNNNAIASVIQAQINLDGTIGTWITCPDLLAKRRRAALFADGRYVHLVGGQDERSTAMSTVMRAQIASDGSIGTWTVLSNSIPTATQDLAVFFTSGKVHLIGGGTSSAGTTRNRIYNAVLNPDGTIGSWVTATNYTDQVRCAQIFLTQTRIYVVGGYKSSTPSNAVRYFAFSGGLNDYTEYFSTSKRATDRGNFKLPDIASSLLGVESYIKT